MFGSEHPDALTTGPVRGRGAALNPGNHDAARVFISLTTLDPSLSAAMEPRASAPAARLDAIGTLAAAGVPVGVMIAPIIPGLNDHEVPALLRAAARSGATHALLARRWCDSNRRRLANAVEDSNRAIDAVQVGIGLIRSRRLMHNPD